VGGEAGVSEPHAPIVIPDSAYPYLVEQRGALDDMRDDPALWCTRYAEMLLVEFDRIEPYLPETCDAILDIGAGMGGIDVLLNRHYGGDVAVTLLDGVRDEPQMTRHSKTFSNYDVARNFLRLNGVRDVRSIDANRTLRAPSFFDLVISLKSWCFHVKAERYAEFVAGCSIAGQTRIIVDMRRRDREPERHYEDFRTMTAFFRHRNMLHYDVKFETHLFENM
jgi:hypothetical protein